MSSMTGNHSELLSDDYMTLLESRYPWLMKKFFLMGSNLVVEDHVSGKTGALMHNRNVELLIIAKKPLPDFTHPDYSLQLLQAIREVAAETWFQIELYATVGGKTEIIRKGTIYRPNDKVNTTMGDRSRCKMHSIKWENPIHRQPDYLTCIDHNQRLLLIEV